MWRCNWRQMFPHRFYLELQRAGRADDEAACGGCGATGRPHEAAGGGDAPDPVRASRTTSRPTKPASALPTAKILGNPKRVRRFTREQYFKSAAQMEALFADIPSAIANTLEIAKRCSLTLVLGKPQLPDFPTPVGQRPAHVAGRVLPLRIATKG